MPEALFRGIVKAGRFCPDDVVRHGGWLAKAEGERVIQSLKRESRGRSMSQNRYYFGVVLAILSEWSGHEPEELHLHFREAILGSERRELPNGTTISYPASTRILTVEQFSDYINKIVRWAAEQSVYIPSSDEL